MLTKSELEQWKADGYVLVKSLFDQEEIGFVLDTARNDPRIQGESITLDDAEGGKSKLTGWNHAGNDLYGMFARCERLVNRMENLLGGEVYHWHSKMMLKEPLVKVPDSAIRETAIRETGKKGLSGAIESWAQRDGR